MAENLDFALTEIIVTQMFGESGGDFPRNTLIAGMNPPNRFEHLLRRHALQQVAKSSCFERPPYLDIPLKCRQDDNSSAAALRLIRPQSCSSSAIVTRHLAFANGR